MLQTQFRLSHPVQKKLKIERLEAAKISIAFRSKGIWHEEGSWIKSDGEFVLSVHLSIHSTATH